MTLNHEAAFSNVGAVNANSSGRNWLWIILARGLQLTLWLTVVAVVWLASFFFGECMFMLLLLLRIWIGLCAVAAEPFYKEKCR